MARRCPCGTRAGGYASCRNCKAMIAFASAGQKPPGSEQWEGEDAVRQVRRFSPGGYQVQARVRVISFAAPLDGQDRVV